MLRWPGLVSVASWASNRPGRRGESYCARIHRPTQDGQPAAVLQELAPVAVKCWQRDNERHTHTRYRESDKSGGVEIGVGSVLVEELDEALALLLELFQGRPGSGGSVERRGEKAVGEDAHS